MTPETDASQPQVDVSAVNPSGPVELNTTNTSDRPLDTTSIPDDCASNGGSYTSTLPDVFDVGMDDTGPQVTGPWIAIDHLTGEMIVDNDDTTGATNTQTGTEIGILQRSSVQILTETEPPMLLFEDEDVCPEWLISAVNEFLQYTPYYGCLSKAIDLFLTQEARLGYPNLVINLHFFSKYLYANTIQSLCAEPFPPPIGLPRLESSRSGLKSILAATVWMLRSSAQQSSSGGSPSSQSQGSNGHQSVIHFQVISHLTTSITVDPMACF